jgi:hypothetical protein
MLSELNLLGRSLEIKELSALAFLTMCGSFRESSEMPKSDALGILPNTPKP